MNLEVRSFFGKEANAYKTALAQLRIEIFREFPYLYDGSLDYEEQYLDTFIGSDSSIIVVAFDGPEVVGVSTGIPMQHEPPNVQQPWIDEGFDVQDIFYLSESVLRKSYRGQGIGLRFFEEREQWARELGFGYATFCGVIRPEEHPLRPVDYVPLDHFWKNRGYQQAQGLICHMHWQEIGEDSESEKALQFWSKVLLPY
ncbi:MAG: GNAT family N-acetyltransferase [Phaeodactylibacter sp.]|nr:GNAT family N-acetyltransferase [Phaeodactylibacter sp.]